MKKTIYHGSDKIIMTPYLGGGAIHNDFGQGYYCTEHEELAKEWACLERRDGFVNEYELDLDGLNVLNLADENDSMLKWVTLLVTYRNLRLSSPVMKRGRDWLQNNYMIELGDVDVVVGYRADDSYFSYARAFLGNQITIGQLSSAMKLGNLREQIVLKSRNAFRQILFVGFQRVDSNVYYPLRKRRDEKARADYMKILENDIDEGLYINDLIRKVK